MDGKKEKTKKGSFLISPRVSFWAGVLVGKVSNLTNALNLEGINRARGGGGAGGGASAPPPPPTFLEILQSY